MGESQRMSKKSSKKVREALKTLGLKGFWVQKCRMFLTVKSAENPAITGHSGFWAKIFWVRRGPANPWKHYVSADPRPSVRLDQIPWNAVIPVLSRFLMGVDVVNKKTSQSLETLEKSGCFRFWGCRKGVCKRCESGECSKIKGFEQLVNANLQCKKCYKLNNDKGLQGVGRMVKTTNKAENPTKSRVCRDCKKNLVLLETTRKSWKALKSLVFRGLSENKNVEWMKFKIAENSMISRVSRQCLTTELSFAILASSAKELKFKKRGHKRCWTQTIITE